MLRFRKMAAAAIAVCMLLTLLPGLSLAALGGISSGLDADDDLVFTTGQGTSDEKTLTLASATTAWSGVTGFTLKDNTNATPTTVSAAGTVKVAPAADLTKNDVANLKGNIVATTADGDITIPVRVKAATPVTGITLSPAATSGEAGATIALTPALQPANTTFALADGVSYTVNTVSGTAGGTVTSAGVLTLSGEGTLTVTAKFAKGGDYGNEEKTATSATITVTAAGGTTTPPVSTPTTSNPPPSETPTQEDVNQAADAIEQADTAQEIEEALETIGLDEIAEAIKNGDASVLDLLDKAEKQLQDLVDAGTVTGLPSATASGNAAGIAITGTSNLLLEAFMENKNVEVVMSPVEAGESKLNTTDIPSDYVLGTAVEVEIDLKVDGVDTETLKMPISITTGIPEALKGKNFRILHFHGINGKGGTKDIITPRVNNDGTCTFGVGKFSIFVFAEYTGTASSGSSKDTPTPIVPVLYDITKAGDTFSYKVLIANGGGNMSGATVTVSMNDHYKSTVTIGSDGVGNGTLEAPGFAAGVAVFYARINGISNPGTTKPMVVSSSGRVLPR